MSNIERTKDFPLAYGATYKGEEFTSITLRRPKMSDVKKLSKAKGDTIEASMETVADLAGKPVGLIDEIDPEDYAPMQLWANDILGKLSPK